MLHLFHFLPSVRMLRCSAWRRLGRSTHIPFCLFFLSIFSALSAQPLHLYIANDDHTDYFWTADDVTYRNAFINQLDYYIGLMESQNGTLPVPFQHRYNCDNSLWVYEYEKAKSSSDFARLISQIKSGHISVPFNPLVPVYGGQNTEIALRGMYYGGYLERRYGIDIDLAVMMENQTLPLGISSLWAGAGAKYSWKGVCSCASPYLDYHDRKHEMYYARGLDGNGVLLKWYDLITNQHLGGYAECRYPNQAIDDLSEKCNTAKYPFEVAGAFGFGWDDLENYLDFFPARAEGKTNAAQQVFVSNELDFFQDFESRYGASIPSQSVSFGNDWDLLITTMAKVSGDVKRSAEKLRTAEAMAALVALKDTSFARDLSGERELAWISLGKYYDHDWTADGQASHDRPQFQRDMEFNFTSYVNSLFNSARTALGNQIQNPSSNIRFFVFNPLGWSRNDVADFPYSGSLPVKVVDVSTQQEVPVQLITISGIQYLRILASGLPPAGYKVFEIQNGQPQALPDAAVYSGGIFENNRFSLSFSEDGSITRLVDKNDGYDYVNGTSINRLEGINPGSATVILENTGPVSVTLACSSAGPIPYTSRYTLYQDVSRVDIDNRILTNPQNTTLQYAFPFAISDPVVWHEEVGAVIKAKRENNGGHYSMQNARYDWQTANHFMYTGNDSRGITLSNLGSHFFKLGNSTIEFMDENSGEIHLLATGKVGYGTLGINNQGGDSFFKYEYSLQPHTGPFDQTASMMLSLEHQNPLVTGIIAGGESYPESAFSLMSIDHPNVLLWSLKPAEEGSAHGLIVRLWNQSGASAFSIGGNPPILSAKHTSHVETDLDAANVADGVLEDGIGNQEIKTYRLFFSDSTLMTSTTFVHRPAIDCRVSPNPVEGQWITLSANGLIPGPYRLSIFTPLGQSIYTERIPVSGTLWKKQIGLGGYPCGLYYIKLDSGSGSTVLPLFRL